MKTTLKKPGITWDILLFFALYIFMPEYFAVELSASLPLITVSRLVLLLLGVMMLIRRRQDVFTWQALRDGRSNLLLTKEPVLRYGLLGYFALILITDIFFLFEVPTAAAKDIFVLIAEQYLLVWFLTLAIDTRQKLEQALKVLAYASGVVALVAIISVIIDINLFYYLKTVSRDMLMANYHRLGMLRAEAGFGHPVFYGAFCVAIIPVMMYLLEKSENRVERILLSASIVLNVSALILSNSRGSMIAFIGLLVVMIPIKLIMRLSKKMILRYISIVLATIVFLGVVVVLSPAKSSFLGNTFGSVLSVIIPGYGEGSDDGTAPPPDEEYGENANGLRSRLVQLTGVRRTLELRPIFGFGPEAQNRGQVKYEFVDGKWWTAKTFDMNFVSIICQYGIAGLLAYIFLYGGVLVTLIRQKMWKDKTKMMFFFSFTAIFLCLLSISSLNRPMWVLIGLFICMVNIKKTPADMTE